MTFPFVEHVGMQIDERRSGHSKCSLLVAPQHFNSTGVVHGAALFTLADTGMGAALYPTLADGEICATIEIKITYFKPVFGGTIECTSELINRGKSVAHLESALYAGGVLVAKASGNFSIFRRKSESTT
jgi:acyl-CoA thioesterase